MRIFFLLFFIVSSVASHGQEAVAISSDSKKGKLYLYWGWNKSEYTSSDIEFKGSDHNFVLNNVKAKDEDLEWNVGKHLNPSRLTIPQFNFRVGYFLNDHWDVSIGTDHMKYIVRDLQTVKISGYIENTGTAYDGVYDNDDIVIDGESFLSLEHTDGLNYVNVALRRNDAIANLGGIIDLNMLVGVNAGVVIPKTNSNFLNRGRNDEFHLSGYGLGATAGLNLTFFDVFFIQSELKGGYINLPSIVTTPNDSDRGKQSFGFSQWNIVFGGYINLNKKQKTKN
ncbi:hypothetical protein AX016_0735 [Cellulophaga sp. RHA19]|uniref:hypothetical protein n=1 Tax=Cellulophaga sp. RHA19 TaxID=1798237 RepID=UPI000C2BC885|nr:hypothetical protein [Cellulophaga sp. RHA19]PKB42567.1 hypothetical protein AX016_0735 [Cellulophaga sp. RHA19]